MLLAPLEPIYSSLMKRRRAANLARRDQQIPSIPVVSVGNLTTGGTGKTPTVQWLAGALEEEFRVGIASRGYGGSSSKSGALVSDGKTVFLSAKEAGDEPILHTRRVPDAIVTIAQNRHHAVELCAQNGAQIAVLDDGFQFWSLPRIFDFVLLDARRPFGNGHLLPVGRLREEPAALERADAIVLTRADLASPEQIQRARAEITKFTSAPIWEAVHAPLDLRDEKTGQIWPLEHLKNSRVTALAALADNLTFERQLEDLGAIVTDDIFRGDHFAWAKSNVPFVAQTVVTTEKDAVKLDPSWFGGRLLSLRIGMQIRDESSLRERIWRKLKAF